MIKNYEIKKIKVLDIKFDPENPNSMTKEQLNALCASLKKFGQLKPPIIDQTNTICDGEQQVRAHLAEGIEEIQVIQISCSPEERRLIRQTTNKLHGTHDPIKDLKEYQELQSKGMLSQLAGLLARREEDFSSLLQQQSQALSTEVLIDTNPMKDKLEAYLYGTIRQVLLYFDQKEYDEIIPKLQKLQEQLGVNNNTKVFMHLLKYYEENKK
jgi:hypothetical protein